MRRGPFLLVGLMVGALLAFPAGIYVARQPEHERPQAAPARPNETGMRDMYSPVILKDPAFLEQQLRGIEALEAHCRATGENCETASAARRWYAETAG